MEGIDPPRGFAFAWFKIGNADIGVYSLHLKSNRITHGNEEISVEITDIHALTLYSPTVTLASLRLRRR
jgi:hypothetical protein